MIALDTDSQGELYVTKVQDVPSGMQFGFEACVFFRWVCNAVDIINVDAEDNHTHGVIVEDGVHNITHSKNPKSKFPQSCP